MINRVVLVGRLVRDPNELRRSTNNNAVTSFTIACDNRFSKQEDRKADFIPCVVWNKTAEFVSQYAKKGALVGIEGRLQSRSYDAKDGHKVFVLEVVCDNVQLLEPKGTNRTSSNLEQPGYPAYEPQPEPQSQPKEEPFNGGVDVPDDDLPF
ncbi:MAG: single-stranded DNA-binding protein [Bacilli bacterium]|jgi:single-strand DNA-binding protein|nr:single-stranded DNA-binding protein [Bacilli bacterium]MDD3422139.1 single-stranded DNA-binding protein [Bacilli bacterium]MDD4065533.1 single-stranded DNA-binding protein [Bacilli bacterium]